MKRVWVQLHTPRGGALFAALVCLLVLLAVCLWVGNWYQNGLVKEERAKAAEQMSAGANALTSAVNQRIALLDGLYAFTRTEWPDTEFDLPFEVYSSDIYFNSTGVLTLMIAPEGIARYIFPEYEDQTLSGYDILNDPDPATRAGVQRAIHTREIALSQPGELRQGGFGITAWRAVYRGNDLWGLVSISLDLQTILTDSGLNSYLGNMNVALRDDSGHTFYGPDSLWQENPVVQTIAMPEGSWELGGAPQDSWDAPLLAQVDLFRLGSFLIAGLLAGVVYLAVNRQGQLLQAVELRTRQIAVAQEKLEQRVQERTQELSTLLNISNRVSSTLALEPLLDQILAEMKQVLDYETASILQMNDEGQLSLISWAGTQPATHDHSPFDPADKAAMDQVMASRRPVIASGRGPTGASTDTGCWMGIPLIVKDRVMGLLAFVHPQAGAYREEDANLALAFAQQVAVAIENARLYEQAGQLAVLEERQRLARELHDSVSQVMYSIGLGVRAARSALTHDPKKTTDALDYVNRLAEAGQVEMHALIYELRPESLRIDGLVVALEKQASVLEARYDLDVQVDFCPEPPIPLALKEILYRISQEATHNIVKHAHATQVSLHLQCMDHHLSMEIVDNGIGFDPAADFPDHFGLCSMRDRAAQSKGKIQIESAPGRGTTVRFSIDV